MELAAAVIGLTFVGYWIDRTFDTGPKGLIIGAVLGVVGGFYNFIRSALSLIRQQEESARSNETGRGDDTNHSE